MNTRTFEIVEFPEMQRQIDESRKLGQEPDTFIPVGNETRYERRKRERKAAKALKKSSRSLTDRTTAFAG
jgi:hypothetical protein